MNNIVVSIIIVTWNNEDIIEKCLDSFNSEDKSIETIVVDNASSDGTVAIIEKNYPGVRLIKNSKNEGFAKANNQAIKISCGDYILLLNSDAFILENSIDLLIDFMNKNDSLGIVGGQLIYPDGSWQRSYGRFPTISFQLRNLMQIERFNSFINKRRRNYSEKSYSIDYIEGACMLIRRKVIDDIGLLDENFFFYGEDADFCYRAKIAGWKVYFVPEAKIVHLRGASSTKKDNYKYMIPLMESQYYFIKKHYNRLYVTAWKLIVKVTVMLRIAFNVFKYYLLTINNRHQQREHIYYKINIMQKIFKTTLT